MSFTPTVGVHLGPDRIRAVRLGGVPKRPPAAFEVDWNPDEAIGAVKELAHRIGGRGAIAVAVDLEFLFVKRVRLPQLPTEERSRILRLEPERYFPTRDRELVFAVRERDDLVFAVSEPRLDRWIKALEALGTVEHVEPAPCALARTMHRAVMPTATLLTHRPGGTEAGIICIQDGVLGDVRRVHGGPLHAATGLAEGGCPAGEVFLAPWSDEVAERLSAAEPTVAVRPLPSVQGVPAEYATALGAALGSGAPVEAALMTPALARKTHRREGRRVMAATAALVAAALFALTALNGYRTRTAERLEEAIAAVTQQANVVLDLQTEYESIRRELEDLTDITAQRMEPLRVLLATSRLLPPGTYLRSIQGAGSDWRFDGYARDAASLIPGFEGSQSFADVRFLRGTNRVRLANEDYEDFSLALRHVRTP